MLKYKLRKIGRKKIIFWSTTMLIFLISMTSIIRYYAISYGYTQQNSGNSGISNGTVYVNDLEKDYNYYTGLNFTEITSASQIPSGVSTNTYNDSNLIPVEITYDGTDINNTSLIGRISATETESKLVYYKYFVKEGNNLVIPLIDNPFTNRPTNYGFNGWVCDSDKNSNGICSHATLSYDEVYYQRYITIDLSSVSYSSGIQLYLNAFWVPANVYNVTTTSPNVGGNTSAVTMQSVNVNNETVMAHYREYTRHVDYSFKNGIAYYIYRNNNYQRSYTYDPDTTYYINTGGNNYRVAVRSENTQDFNVNIHYEWDAKEQSIGTKSVLPFEKFTSLYYLLNGNYGNRDGYYTITGVECSNGGSCNSSAYKLIQSTDAYAGDLYQAADTSQFNTFVEGNTPVEGDRIFDNCTDSDDNQMACEINKQATSYYSNYKYLVTRDINIVVINAGTNNNPVTLANVMTSNPVTISSSPFGTGTIRRLSGNATAGNDMVLEHVSLSGSTFYGNYNNVKFGRDIQTYGTYSINTVYGGSSTSSTSTTVRRYHLNVETGYYNDIYSTYSERVSDAIATYGSDYDRVYGNNISGVNGGRNNLFNVRHRVYTTATGSKTASAANKPYIRVYMKSGCVGCTAGNQFDTSNEAGFYLISNSGTSGDTKGLSYFEMDGGYVKTVQGGASFDTSTTANAVAIHVNGGTVGTIFGGARRYTTVGNRVIAVTGGNILFNVFGGSNAYDEGEGIGSYNSLVYIGGTAYIGATSDVTYNNNSIVFASTTGNVFGAGNGRNGANAGAVSNSHVVINGGTIKGDAYGGGNFGAVGSQVQGATTTVVDILKGSILGNVYGGANQNGAGTAGQAGGSCNCNGTVCINHDYYYIATGTVIGYWNYVPRRTYYYDGYSITSTGNGSARCYNGSGCPTFTRVGRGDEFESGITYYDADYEVVNPATCTPQAPSLRHNITINMSGGAVSHSVYGGSNISGTIQGNTTLEMSGGTVSEDIFGGGKGTANTNGTNVVMGNVVVNAKGTNARDVYGGSALGRVNGNGAGTQSSFTTKVNVSAGTINDVYGCGMGATGTNINYPYTNGQSTVTISGTAEVRNVFGGNNSSGTGAYPTQVELVGGTVKMNAYGGGNKVGHTTTNIHLAGTHVGGTTNGGNVFGGSNESGAVTTTNVVIDSGTVSNVFGGNNLGGSVTTSKVIFNNATISENVYGSGYQAATTTTNVTINGGTIKNVFGGGMRANVSDESRVLVANGNITEGVYGGSNNSGTVDESYVYISNGTIGNVFGGNNAGGKTNDSNVYIGGGSITGVYGGGNQVNTGNTHVYVYAGIMDKIFGGDNNVVQQGDTPTYTDSTQVFVYGGTSPYVFGGSNIEGRVTATEVNIQDNVIACTSTTAATGIVVNPCYSKGARAIDDVYGGNNAGGLAVDTVVNIKDTAHLEDVFGGGNEAKVINSTTVNMYNGNVENVYGGGNKSFVGDATEIGGAYGTGTNPGETNVYIARGTVRHNVYGSSNASFVFGDTHVYVGDVAYNQLGGNAVFGNNATITIGGSQGGGSLFGGSETNASESTQYNDGYEGVHGNSYVYLAASKYNKTNINVAGSLYGSGNNSSTSGNSYIFVNDYGTKANIKSLNSIQRSKYVYLTDSVVELKGERDRALPTKYLYGLIRIEHFYLLGSSGTSGTGSTLHMAQGASSLHEYNSGTMGSGNTATYNSGNFTVQVRDDDGTLHNSNNELFMYTNIIFAVSETPAPVYEAETTSAGSVHGMTYLGMYNKTGNSYNYGMYDPTLGDGDNISNVSGLGDRAYTFVYGKDDYKEDPTYQIKNHGFYSHYKDDEDDTKLAVKFVDVTPLGVNYYKWILGKEPLEIKVSLQATKSTVEGAHVQTIDLEELKQEVGGRMVDWHDATVNILDVDTTTFIGQKWDAYLVDKTQIPTVATGSANIDGLEVTDANRYFALSMGTSTSGWLNNYKTNIYDQGSMPAGATNYCTGSTGQCTGDYEYTYDSTTKPKSLSFWLYYSKNLDFDFPFINPDEEFIEIPLGSVNVYTEFYNPHPNDPTVADQVSREITVVIEISLVDNKTPKYAAAITAGKQYEMFERGSSTITEDGAVSIYQMLSVDLAADYDPSTQQPLDVDENTLTANKLYSEAQTVTENGTTTRYSAAYRYLKTDYQLPVGTRITMLDLKDNKEYYYEVENLTDSVTGFDYYRYRLDDFTLMGNTDTNNSSKKYSDDMHGANSTKYFTKYNETNAGFAVEEFIFTIDFAEAGNHTNYDPHYIYMEIAKDALDANNNVIGTYSLMYPIGTPTTDMRYTVVPDVETSITTDGYFLDEYGQPEVDGSGNPEHVSFYKKNSEFLELNTDLKSLNSSNEQVAVSDTTFNDYKLGAKITVMQAVKNQQGQITGYIPVTTNLFGSVFKIGSHEYYPQTDGSIRLMLAGRMTTITSDIALDFSNSDMEFGDYKLVVETFASFDGLYYGDFEPTVNEFTFTLLNDEYGIDVSLPPVQVTRDSNSGKDKNGDLDLSYTLTTKNGLAHPNVKVHLERRKYSTEKYDTAYVPVSLGYVANSMSIGGGNNILNSTCFATLENGDCYIYNLTDLQVGYVTQTFTVDMAMKPGPDDNDLANLNNAKWKSGTYRVVFDIYDGSSYIGSVYEYLIIRSLNVDEEIEGS